MRNEVLAWVAAVALGGCGYSTGDYSQSTDAARDTASGGDSAASVDGGDSATVDSTGSGDSSVVDTAPPPTCGGSTTACGGACVDIGKDPNNCGGCGIKCDPGQSCRGGGCR